MSRKAVSFGGAVVLAVAVLVMTATPANAFGWHRGGWGWGGGRYGGFYAGSYPYYGYGYGYSPGYYGYSGYYRGYYPQYGYYGSYYPYYSSYYSYPYYSYSSPYYTYSSLTPATYQSFYPSTTSTPNATETESNNSARITVTVPPGAEVWFDDHQTSATGTSRNFVTPPLPTGKEYGYDIKARWMENGREVSQKQHVSVSAGADVNVRFPMSSTETGTEPGNRNDNGNLPDNGIRPNTGNRPNPGTPSNPGTTPPVKRP